MDVAFKNDRPGSLTGVSSVKRKGFMHLDLYMMFAIISLFLLSDPS